MAETKTVTQKNDIGIKSTENVFHQKPFTQNFIEGEDDQELQNMKDEIKDNLSDIRSNDDEDELSDAELKDVVTDNKIVPDQNSKNSLGNVNTAVSSGISRESERDGQTKNTHSLIKPASDKLKTTTVA